MKSILRLLAVGALLSVAAVVGLPTRAAHAQTAANNTFDATAVAKHLLGEAKQTLDAYNQFDLPRAGALDQKMTEEVAQLWSTPSQVEAVVDSFKALVPEAIKLGISFGYETRNGTESFEFSSWEDLLPGQTDVARIKLRFELVVSTVPGLNIPPTVVGELKDGCELCRNTVSIPKAIPKNKP